MAPIESLNVARSSKLGIWLSRIAAICFGIAALGHFRAILIHGWFPYRFAPLTINAYWTSLAFLDSIIAVCLLWRPRPGWIVALVIMVSDVAVNSYATNILGPAGSFFAFLRAMQWLFLAFLIATLPFVWRQPASPHTET